MTVENVARIKSELTINVGGESKNPKEHHMLYLEYYIWNPTACSCENSKNRANIIDDSVIPDWWNYRYKKKILFQQILMKKDNL